MSQSPAANTAFGQLHHGSRPLFLTNSWDEVSARVMQHAGAPALGTSSFAIAVSKGYFDGEQMPWETALEIIESIVAAVEVPVTVDIESGRGSTPEDVASTVRDVVGVGAAGINLEDTLPSVPGLMDLAQQVDRLQAARSAGGDELFINARCDAYFTGQPPDDPLAAAVERAGRYGEAGADGFFIPGLNDLDQLRRLTRETDLPVNVMVGPGSPPIDLLTDAGARRLSQGAWPFAAFTGHLEKLVRGYLDGGYGDPEDAATGYQQLGALVVR